MSAFVISKATMTRVVRGICESEPRGFMAHDFLRVPLKSANAPTLIGRRLFSLNIEAVMQRYPDCAEDPNRMPGDADSATAPETFRCEDYRPLTHKERIASLKALQCLIYQCSEGDIPERQEYRELRDMERRVMARIVEALPEYEAAPWD